MYSERTALEMMEEPGTEAMQCVKVGLGWRRSVEVSARHACGRGDGGQGREHRTNIGRRHVRHKPWEIFGVEYHGADERRVGHQEVRQHEVREEFKSS